MVYLGISILGLWLGWLINVMFYDYELKFGLYFDLFVIFFLLEFCYLIFSDCYKVFVDLFNLFNFLILCDWILLFSLFMKVCLCIVLVDGCLDESDSVYFSDSSEED